MAIVGGVTGALMGGVAGVDHAVEDDSVDLPTLDEYEQLVKNGNFLVWHQAAQSFINANCNGDCIGNFLVVSGQYDHAVDSKLTQLLDGGFIFAGSK